MHKYDLILWGATSFVGKITAKYITQKYSINKNLKWAIAGRNINKLNKLKDNLELLDPAAKNLSIYTGSIDNKQSLLDIAKLTKVIATTVGPYMKYGEPIIAACAEAGTDYCDLTGEAPFVKKMQDLYHARAQKSGSRIVCCCGVDSIPSDLGVDFLNQLFSEKHNTNIQSAKTYIKAFKGEFSGGTIESVINMIENQKACPNIKKTMSNPYALCLSSNNKNKLKQPSLIKYNHDQETGLWLAPFLMASINSKVVHATNDVLSNPYGDSFIYSEYSVAKNKYQAIKNYLLLITGFMALTFKPTRYLLKKFVLPKSGQGPSIEAQQAGYFNFTLHGTDKNNNKKTIEVTGNEDPGYGASAKMLAEAAICMALDIDKSKLAGGFWTPASSMGKALRTRLINNAQILFTTC